MMTAMVVAKSMAAPAREPVRRSELIYRWFGAFISSTCPVPW